MEGSLTRAIVPFVAELLILRGDLVDVIRGDAEQACGYCSQVRVQVVPAITDAAGLEAELASRRAQPVTSR